MYFLWGKVGFKATYAISAYRH